jgi:Mg-chelatase subunit ChlD
MAHPYSTGEAPLTRGWARPTPTRFLGLGALVTVIALAVVERASSGLEIVNVPRSASKSAITVYGQARQRTSILFVFDCSGSMNTKDSRGVARIRTARQSLEAILERLANSDRPYDVGVMIYGRRVGWNPARGRENELVIRDPNHPDRFLPKPDDLHVHPSDDVETILRLGPFTPAKRREVNRELDASRPMGETPLYLSIVRAIESFPAESAAGRLHIVLITDGFNEQSEGGPKGVMKFREDAENLLRRPGNQGMHLDIVGFNLTPSNADERRSLKDLQELTAETGGRFYSVNDPSGLLKALETSLNLLQYVVRPAAGGASVTPQPLDLGTTCRIEQPPGLPRAFTAEIVDTDRPARAEVVIAGGESLELYLADDSRTGQRRLVHHRYDTDWPSPSLRESHENLPDPLDADRQVFLGSHLPEWQGTALRFPLSVQNANAALFSPRPAEAWVQIKPVLPKGSAGDRVYPFYDLSFEPERPVPVLSCLAPNWPVEAKQAEIHVWCKFTKTAPDKVIVLAQLPGEPVRLDGVPDVTLEVELKRSSQPEDPWQVHVVERHPADSDLYSLKVDMEPVPNKVIHRFNSEAGTVRHTFFCNASTATIDSYRVCLTTRKRLVQKAVAPPQPFLVTVPRLTLPAER